MKLSGLDIEVEDFLDARRRMRLVRAIGLSVGPALVSALALTFIIGGRYAPCEEHRNNDRTREALDCYLELAESGDAEAQLFAGVLSLHVGAPIEVTKTFLRKAAKQDNVPAQTMFGMLLLKEAAAATEESHALAWLQRAAEQDYPASQIELAFTLLSKLRFVRRDEQQAIYWFKRAAFQGDAKAQAVIGKAYAEGFVVEQDHRLALRWLRRAARQENAVAECEIGKSFEEGRGDLRPNLRVAKSWYRRAAEKGLASAKSRLAEIVDAERMPVRRNQQG